MVTTLTDIVPLSTTDKKAIAATDGSVIGHLEIGQYHPILSKIVSLVMDIYRTISY